MPSRRFHNKSRHGCTNCKQRKIRCGEERPTCANCNRLGGHCSFLDSDPRGGLTVPTTSTASGDSASASASASSTPQASTSSPYGQSLSHSHSPEYASVELSLDRHDDGLFRRYTEATCFTLTDKFERNPMWQITVPGLAASHPFLKHGLLALAAMHTRYTSPLPMQPTYFDIASHHQDKALESYIPQLQSITPENCHALFAFSALLCSIQYSFISALDADIGGNNIVTEIINTFEYLLGATEIATVASPWLRQGGMAPLMDPPPPPSGILADLLDEPKAVLSSLITYVQYHDFPLQPLAAEPEGGMDLLATAGPGQLFPAENVQIYVHSIEMLTLTFPTHDTSRRYLGDLTGFPFFVGKEFIRLLKVHDPMALVILAHYGVALQAFNHFWWLEGLGARLIRAVSHMLTPEFQILLQWPLAKISNNWIL